MPHIVVKMFAGRSDADKARLADALSRAVIETLGSTDKSISVGIEDIKPENWGAEVYRPDIAAKLDTIFKAPGYDPPA
ncbi:tautomerase family protein [Undibacter mobilis]|uniref:4-oxalocrotonate tautomerase n=1 Tax=Undibacter mobilis TaxID=2292256 RepID=A0A371B6S0_9BRAD|nr:tautomerase family protein [Undibacter mobilis]RDV03202.1 4-oxalocrotonate tautomerase [Undibacter mobilis]